MKRLAFITVLAILGMATLSAQQNDTIPSAQEPVQQEVQAQPEKEQAPPAQKKSHKDKIYFGGYVNLSFGKYTVIGVEPMIGYKVIPRISVGAKIRYDYISDKRYAVDYNTHTYGGSIFTRTVLFRGLYAHAEFAEYNYELYDLLGSSSRQWIPYLFLGAGFSQRVGARTSLNAQVLFDVLQHQDSPYGRWEPFYSVGMGVGF